MREDTMANHTESQVLTRINTLTESIGLTHGECDLTRLYIERGNCYEQLEDTPNSVRDYLMAFGHRSTEIGQSSY